MGHSKKNAVCEKGIFLVNQKEFFADIQGKLGSRATAAATKLGHHKQMTSPVTDCLGGKGSALDWVP